MERGLKSSHSNCKNLKEASLKFMLGYYFLLWSSEIKLLSEGCVLENLKKLLIFVNMECRYYPCADYW